MTKRPKDAAPHPFPPMWARRRRFATRSRSERVGQTKSDQVKPKTVFVMGGRDTNGRYGQEWTGMDRNGREWTGMDGNGRILPREAAIGEAIKVN
jgi:hypothetical protein